MEIPLTLGKVAIVNAADFSKASCHEWYACFQRGRWYAMRGVRLPSGKKSVAYLHQLILGAKDGYEIDHRDGNGLNNRMKNLRFATRSQNNANQKKRIGLSSRFKGVTWDKRLAAWRAQIHQAGTTYFLGRFKCELSAARAYNRAARKLFGVFSRPNPV